MLTSAPPVPAVTGIDRASPAGAITAASSVTYAVNFNTAVTPVQSFDFLVVTGGSATYTSPVVVAGSGSAYTVTVNGVRGSGTLELDLVNRRTIRNSANQVMETSFAGAAYTILQPSGVSALSLSRTNPAGPVTGAPNANVQYTLTFSGNVTGVDPTDFQVVTGGGLGASPAVTVTPVSGSVYKVQVNGITGSGTVGLNLLDDGSIRDTSGYLLRPSAAIAGTLAQGQTFATGMSGPVNVVVADLNRDGKSDVAVANTAGVSVLLGNGNGTLAASTTTAVAAGGGMDVGDLAGPNIIGDGIADLAVSGPGSINVLDRVYDAGYYVHPAFQGVGDARQVVVADVNRDGWLDVVYANPTAGTAGVVLRAGTTPPASIVQYPSGAVATGAGNDMHVAVKDVNGDGFPDLIASNASDGTIGVSAGNGDGTFAAAVTFAAGPLAGWVQAEDVNGDLVPDLEVASVGASSSVGILIGNGNGTFAAPMTYASDAQPTRICVTDLNADGRPDLVVTTNGGGAVDLFMGNGNGTFADRAVVNNGGVGAWSAGVGDFNQDGRPDLFVGNASGSVGSVFLNASSGGIVGQTYTVALPPSVTSIVRSSPTGMYTTSGSLTYAVTFSAPVTGVDPTDFALVSSGSVSKSSVSVSGSGASYLVTAVVHGSGTVGLELVDNDTIVDALGTPLNRAGANGSYVGPDYSVVEPFPSLVSIARANPAGSVLTGGAVSYTVTFSAPVTGVDSTDFALALGGGATALGPVTVTPVSGSVYAVTVNGVVSPVGGAGTIGLNLVDNNSIRDLWGNPLRVVGGGPTLAPSQTFASNSGVYYLTSADFNLDGKPDLAFERFGVMLGNGNGTFQAARQTIVNGGGSGIATADMNGDGKPDVVIASYDGTGNKSRVTIYVGDGNGNFAQSATINPGGSFARYVAVGDLNGDGKPDMVVANYYGSSTITTILGTGTGSFGATSTFAADANPKTVALADMNGDGALDIVATAQSSGRVAVYLGNGNGTFQPRLTFASGTQPWMVAAGDLNRDGKADLVTTLAGQFGQGYQIGAYLGNGDGTLGAMRTFSTGATIPISVALSDVTGDGILDAVVVDTTTYMSVLPGNGDGTFGPAQMYAGGSQQIGVVTSDFNGDGRPDVAVSNPSDGRIYVDLGVGPGTFVGPVYSVQRDHPAVTSINRSNPAGPVTAGATVSYTVNFTAPVTGVEASDFRLVTDSTVAVAGGIVVTGSGAGYTVSVSGIRGRGSLELELVDDDSIVSSGIALGGAGIGNGSFHGQAYSILQTLPAVVSIGRGFQRGPKIPADSITYIVTFSEPVTGVDVSDFVVSLNGVTFNAPVVVAGGPVFWGVTLNGVSGSGSFGINLVDDGSIRDADGNGLRPAAVTSVSGPQAVAMGANSRAARIADVNGDGRPDLLNLAEFGSHVLLGNGDGTFGAANTFATGQSTQDLAVADLNGDGKPDLIACNLYNDFVSVLMGNGDGTFAPQQTVGLGTTPATLWQSEAVSDLNGDGAMDLVVLSRYGVAVALLGNGDGTFRPAQTMNALASGPSVALADVNGDGRADLIAVEFSGSSVHVLPGNGDGTFGAGGTIAVGPNTNCVAVADVTGDGKADVVVSASGISVLAGNGDGTFKANQSFAAVAGTQGVVLADVNGDGKLDALLGGGAIAVLLGSGTGTFAPPQTLAAGMSGHDVAMGDLNGDGRADFVVADSPRGGTVGALLLGSASTFVGDVSVVLPVVNTIAGTGGDDAITLTQDQDHNYINWTTGSSSGRVLIGDPNGLTINGNGGNDVITLDYINDNPLPGIVHLNGTFTINGLQGYNPFVGISTLDVGRSTVRISYAGPASDPVAAIKGYLSRGYAGGSWAGTATASTGVITSTDAKNNPLHNTGIAWVDSAEGSPLNMVANTVLLKYAVIGDTDLDGTVGLSDYTAVVRNFGVGANWTQGVVTYGGTVGLSDYTAVVRNFGQSVPVVPAAAPGVVPAGANATVSTEAGVYSTTQPTNEQLSKRRSVRGPKLRHR